MTRREAFKELKEQKLFGRFCLVMATAYRNEIYPRQTAEEYFNIMESLSLFSLIEAVKNWNLRIYLNDSQIKARML
jgi:hypothetical protein